MKASASSRRGAAVDRRMLLHRALAAATLALLGPAGAQAAAQAARHAAAAADAAAAQAPPMASMPPMSAATPMAQAAESSGATAAVDIRNFAFVPAQISVNAGARVVWTNRDDEAHLVVSTDGAFKPSPALDTDDTFAMVFDKPGTYPYFCAIHPMMRGTVVVR